MKGAVVLAAAVPAVAAGAVGSVVPLSGRVEPVHGVVREQASRVEIASETAEATTYAVPADVLFAFDSARVTAGGRAALRRLEVRGRRVTVVGHTDARGSAAYNLRLSRRRAAAVARVLGGDAAVRARGEAEPVASNARPAGRARNRRVEIVVSRR